VRLKLGKFPLERLFFTADTHFDHKLMLEPEPRGCGRPFGDIDVMREELISLWNQKVPKNGLVIHAGDLAWKNMAYYLEQLNGDIILVEGNHDRVNSAAKKLLRSYCELLHLSVTLPGVKIEKIYMAISHYPMRSWWRSCHGSWHLHGHSHGKGNSWRKSLDIGVDAVKRPPSWRFAQLPNGVALRPYTPLSFREVYWLMKGTL